MTKVLVVRGAGEYKTNFSISQKAGALWSSGSLVATWNRPIDTASGSVLYLSEQTKLLEKFYTLTLTFDGQSVPDGTEVRTVMELAADGHEPNSLMEANMPLRLNIKAHAHAHPSCETSGVVQNATTSAFDHNEKSDPTFSVDVLDVEGILVNDTRAEVTASWRTSACWRAT